MELKIWIFCNQFYRTKAFCNADLGKGRREDLAFHIKPTQEQHIAHLKRTSRQRSSNLLRSFGTDRKTELDIYIGIASVTGKITGKIWLFLDMQS